MICVRCGSKLSKHNTGDECSLCEAEIEKNLDRAQVAWQYAERKLYEERQNKIASTEYRQRYYLEHFADMLYTYMYLNRVPDPVSRMPMDYFVGDPLVFPMEWSTVNRSHARNENYMKGVLSLLESIHCIDYLGDDPLTGGPRFQLVAPPTITLEV